MQRRSLLLVVGVLCFLVFLIAKVPAQLAVDMLSATGIRSGTVSGSFWSGQINSLQLGKVKLGKTAWTLRPSRLVLGRLAADIDAELADGFLRGRAELGLGGSWSLVDAEAASPVSDLAPLLGLPVRGGEATANIERLTVEDAWPSTAIGELRVGDLPLSLPGVAADPNAQGSFALRFSAMDLEPEDPLIGELKDLGGALELQGEVALSAPTNYTVSGALKPRPNAPESLTQGLVLLGPEDAQGRREFSLSGSF